MRSKIAILAVLLTSFGVVLLDACGPGSRPDEPDANGPCDASQTFCGTDVAGEAICADLASDALNCGVCGYECRQPATNACVDGACACASTGQHVSDACDDPSVCAVQSGQCIVPDMEHGAACDPVDNVPCADTNQLCVGGFCTVPDCDHPEICDGHDNDCDGHTDSTGSHPGEATPLQQDCYTGDPSEEGVGLCRHGEQSCRNGVWESCAGEVLPTPEDGVLDCDGLDNDCNACIDDHLDEHGVPACGTADVKKFDIVFIIDRSGSMVSTITAVVAAVRNWATNIGTNPNIRFALVDPTTNNDSDGVSVALPLSNYVVFTAAMTNVTADGASTEPMHYATQLVLSGSYNAQLHFAEGSTHVVIVIHDESTTNVANSVNGYNEESVCASVTSNTVLAVITHTYLYEDWDLCTSETDTPPTEMPLTDDAGTMLSSLNRIIASACQP